jgi:hypothetical protein
MIGAQIRCYVVTLLHNLLELAILELTVLVLTVLVLAILEFVIPKLTILELAIPECSNEWAILELASR